MRYLRDSATIDLADDVGSLGDGLHLAAAAGTWLAVACGFGGFRVRDGVAAFRPQLPPGSRRLRFRLRFRATLLDVAVDADSCTYGVVDGEAITVLHDGDPIRVVPGGSVRCAAVASAANRSGRSSA
jgi:alpha,alpha-trehalose phosphorylase